MNRHRGWTLALVSTATFMLMLDLTVVYVALADMQETYSSSFSALQWVLDAYAVGLAVFLLTAGSLADRLGRKRVFLAGLTVFILASLACGLATDVIVLSTARAVQGIGGAVLYAVGPALIGHEYRGKDRAVAFGLFGAVTGLAIALGPLIGGALTAWDWRYIFLVNVPVGIVALALAKLRLHESRETDPRPVDWWGLSTFCVALALLTLAVLRGEDQGWTSPIILGLFAAFALSLAFFVAVERRAGDDAMLDLRLFRNRTFVAMGVATALCAGSFMFAIFIFTAYLQNIVVLSAWEVGVRMLPLTVSLFVAAAVSGALAERLPVWAVTGGALLAITAGLLLVTSVNAESAWTAILPGFIIGGAGMGLFTGRRSALAIAMVEPARAGMASGINVTFQQVGTAIGIAALGALFQNRVSADFAQSTVGHVFGEEAAASVAADGGSRVFAAAGQPGLAAQALDAARSAFMVGFDVVMVVAATVALVGAVVAFAFIRRRDLHETSVN
ncbi:MFS transporter [Micromonospora sp. NPDC049102]|uniref:MFS transporter n=1 Tax=Micromonospora sp. NPDC049102 TaxID=3364265 RepID=UPI003711811D